ncbi:MAG: nucleotide pyrophosphohydrolase [Candidatus Nanohaloarchaeota archaeon QJJ-7]|nr:nucleotide pyrophosphohydrolase [Candidatus Nanohaloarchaeota archaeon QJJ-7]
MEDQEKARNFIMENSLQSGASVWVHDLQSELGEVSKELLKASDYGDEEVDFPEEMEEEVGDIYFSLLGLADELGIDLSSSLETVLEKYRERAEESGDPGSGY